MVKALKDQLTASQLTDHHTALIESAQQIAMMRATRAILKSYFGGSFTGDETWSDYVEPTVQASLPSASFCSSDPTKKSFEGAAQAFTPKEFATGSSSWRAVFQFTGRGSIKWSGIELTDADVSPSLNSTKGPTVNARWQIRSMNAVEQGCAQEVTMTGAIRICFRTNGDVVVPHNLNIPLPVLSAEATLAANELASSPQATVNAAKAAALPGGAPSSPVFTETVAVMAADAAKAAAAATAAAATAKAAIEAAAGSALPDGPVMEGAEQINIYMKASAIWISIDVSAFVQQAQAIFKEEDFLMNVPTSLDMAEKVTSFPMIVFKAPSDKSDDEMTVTSSTRSWNETFGYTSNDVTSKCFPQLFDVKQSDCPITKLVEDMHQGCVLTGFADVAQGGKMSKGPTRVRLALFPLYNEETKGVSHFASVMYPTAEDGHDATVVSD